MDASNGFRQRQFRLLMLYALGLLPLIGFGAFQALQSNSNSPLNWVPATFPARAVYDEHTQRFGYGDVIFLSWEGCSLGEARLDEFLQSLRQGERFVQQDGTPYFPRVVCGREIVDRLTAGPRPVNRETAIKRLRGTLIGRDSFQTMVIVTFTPEALKERSRLVELIQSEVVEQFGVPESEQHLAGPVIDGLSVDRAGRASLDRLTIFSSVVVLILSVVCLGSVRGGLIVFGLSVYCQFATLALIHYTGESLSALLIVLPPLIQVLAVAGGVHLTNYYYDAREALGVEQAPQSAIRQGWLPCLLSAGTTALGIGSLMVSQLSPIRLFGLYGSVGVLMTAGLAVVLVPAIWTMWPPNRVRANAFVGAGMRSSSAGRTTNLIDRFWGVILAVFLTAIVGSVMHLRDLQTSVRIETLFGRDSRILSDYRWIEERVGPLVPIDLVVSWPEQTELSLKERLLMLWKIQLAARSLPEAGASMSAIQLLPSFPSRSQLPAEQYDRTLEFLLSESQPAFTEAGFLVRQDGRNYWRVTVQVSALHEIDYGAFLKKLESAVAPAVAGLPKDQGPELEYTGIMPLVHEIQRQLMRDLFESFLGALLLITLVMTISQAGILAGLVAMIPNVFPVLLLFGILGLYKTRLDIGTVTTASVALGISVDDTLHFLTFFQRALQQGKSRLEAVEFAFRHCGMAMIQTSVICGFGLLVFGQAEFLPTQRFAWITASLIGAALAADLCLLPALLLSPLGALFDCESPKRDADEKQASPTDVYSLSA
jgi:predicted RND superfamily exporter protein